MKSLSVPGRYTRRLLAGAGAAVITASLSAAALAAAATTTSAASIGRSTRGPAGFRPKPALKP